MSNRLARDRKKTVKAADDEVHSTGHYFPIFCIVNAAFRGTREWYSGIVIDHAVDKDLSSRYTILYDDGDIENNVEEICIELKCCPTGWLY